MTSHRGLTCSYCFGVLFSLVVLLTCLAGGVSLIPCDNVVFSITSDGDYALRCPTPIVVRLMAPTINVSSLSVSLEIFTPFYSFAFGKASTNKTITWIDVLNLSVTLSLSYEWTDANCTMYFNSSTTKFRAVSMSFLLNGSFVHRVANLSVIRLKLDVVEHLEVAVVMVPGSALDVALEFLFVDALDSAAMVTANVDINEATVKSVSSTAIVFVGCTNASLTLSTSKCSTVSASDRGVLVSFTAAYDFAFMFNCDSAVLSLSTFSSILVINDLGRQRALQIVHHTKFNNVTAGIVVSSTVVSYPATPQLLALRVLDEIVNSTFLLDTFGGLAGCPPSGNCGSFLNARTAIRLSNITIGGTSSWYSGPFRNVSFALEDNSMMVINGSARIVLDTNMMSTASRQDLGLLVAIAGNSTVVVLYQPPGPLIAGFSFYDIVSPLPKSFAVVDLAVSSNSLLSFARMHDSSVGWLVSAGLQQSLAVDQLLVTIEGSTVVTPLSSWRQCAGPSSRLPRLPHMFSVDVAARSVGVSVVGSVIALVSAAAPDRVVLSLPMSVPRSFAAADARWADDGPLVPGNCTRTSSFVAPDVVVGFKVSRAATVSLPAVATAAVLGVEVGSVALSLVAGSTAMMAMPVGVSATQMSLAASRLSLRCRDQSSGNEAAAGEGPLDNPLQMQLDSFTSPAARSAAGALTGNTVLWLSVSALDAVVTAVRELRTTKVGADVRWLSRVYQTIARRMPGLVASSFAVVHQPSLISSLTLLISTGRTVLSGFFGVAGMLLFAGLPLWWSLAVFLGVRRKRIAAVELVDSKRQQTVRRVDSLKRIASFLVAPRWRWQPAVASDNSNDALFVAAFGSFFADFRRGCAMYYAFDAGMTVLTSLCVAIGLSLSVEAICDLTAVANWFLFALGCVRLVTTAYLRPMSAPLANALAISFAALSATSTLLSALGYDEGAMWSGAIEAAFLAASSVGTLILRLSVALWLKCDVKQHSPTAATIRRPLRTTYANDGSVAELSRLIETICRSRTAMKRI